jgi:DNA mismatch endonuclease (patch repair protein)
VTDHVNAETRSKIMRAVHSTDTKPELAIRKMVHALGFRYRLNVETLPGKPDMVFPSRHKIIFMHGCFWHRHKGCRYATSPKTRPEFWHSKFDSNVRRDRAIARSLKKLGWAVMTVWQCQLKNPEKLSGRLNDFLAD